MRRPFTAVIRILNDKCPQGNESFGGFSRSDSSILEVEIARFFPCATLRKRLCITRARQDRAGHKERPHEAITRRPMGAL